MATQNRANGGGFAANISIDPRRIELAVALAAQGSQDLADIQNVSADLASQIAKAEQIEQGIARMVRQGDQPELNQWKNSLANARTKIANDKAAMQKDYNDYSEVTATWQKYQLDDVTVGVLPPGGPVWRGESGFGCVVTADNAGKILPGQTLPSSFWDALDAITFGIPIFKAIGSIGRTAVKELVEEGVEKTLQKNLEENAAKQLTKELAEAAGKDFSSTAAQDSRGNLEKHWPIDGVS